LLISAIMYRSTSDIIFCFPCNAEFENNACKYCKLSKSYVRRYCTK
jgi:hypothetical protein